MPPERFLDLADRNAADRQELIEKLTIRTTWFMREPDAILALAAAFKKRAALNGSHRVALWSVACATGEEPYTLAMALVDAGLEPIILATDISAEARAVAELGQYPRSRIDELPLRWRQRFFLSAGADRVQVAPAHPRRRHLRRAQPGRSRSGLPPGWAMFDAIVCRNVLLYFDRDEAVRLLRELSLSCREEGYVLLSAAEHPLAWSISNLGFEPKSETPLLRRRRRHDTTSVPVIERPAEAPERLDPAGLERRPPGHLGAHLAGPRRSPACARLAGRTVRRPPARAQSTGPRRPGRRGRVTAAPPTPRSCRRPTPTARQGDVESALVMLKRIVERDALAAPAYLAMGLLWKKQGRLAEATSALRRARFLFGDDSWLAPYTLAVCLEARGDWREALEGYRQAAAVLEWGGPSGLVDPESNEQDFASTVLESCLRRMGTLQSRT